MRLYELRSNPKSNVKINAAVELNKIYSAHSNEELYIHFGNELKFGLNPSPEYNTTPLGMYAYPLEYVIQMGLEHIPYAATSKYIWIFKFIGDKSKLWNLGDPISEDFAYDLEDSVMTVLGDDAQYDLDGAEEDFISTGGYGDDNDEDHYGELYNTGMVAYYSITSCVNNAVNYGYVSNMPLTLRKILTTVGLSGVVDPGTGRIHRSERTQAVFFNPKDLAVIDMLNNNIFGKNAVMNKAIASKSRYNPEHAYSQATYYKNADPGVEPSRDIIDSLLQSPLFAAKYAIEIMGKPWPEAEQKIKQNDKLWQQYISHFGLDNNGNELNHTT